VEKCELRVNPRLTKDHRARCGKGGKFYIVSGGVGFLILYCCARHARKLASTGLELRPATELEAAAFQRERESFNSLCTCFADPFTCPLEAHQVRARQNAIANEGRGAA
jgi:hypothetical protein